MQSLQALKHFAAQQKKPLVISWSQNNHEGFHDGTSTMARFIGDYCKDGNLLALCASNEGDGRTYIERTLSKGKSLSICSFVTETFARNSSASGAMPTSLSRQTRKSRLTWL